MLVFIHDIIYSKEQDRAFIYSNTYKELHEEHHVTVFKYLKISILVGASFVVAVNFLKSVPNQARWFEMFFYLVISCIFGFLFLKCWGDFKELHYQIKAKKAVQFALQNYSYQQYVLFLDQYLSECSSASYAKRLK